MVYIFARRYHKIIGSFNYFSLLKSYWKYIRFLVVGQLPFLLIISFRTMRSLWETRVSPNVVYSLQHLQNDTATLVIGGIDGVLRILDQNTGEVLSSCVVEGNMLSTSKNPLLGLERRKGRRLSEDAQIDSIPRSTRPPITCLAVGMEKVVTTHNSRYIRLWKFKKWGINAGFFFRIWP